LVEIPKLEETLFRDLPNTFKLDAIEIIPEEAVKPLVPNDINVDVNPLIVGRALANKGQGTNEKDVNPLVAELKN